jgi:predicted nucleic acid-binding Zn ribbon protein
MWYTGLVPEQYKRKPNIECLVCKKYIYRRPSEITENKSRVFCSAKCYGISCRKETFCVICGKSILAGLNKKTCSRLCANKNRVGVQYKSNQPRNKVVTLRRLKISLLESRGQKCERCSYNKSKILQVHHKNRDRRNNNLENLELICPNCHYEEHYL